MAEDWEPYLDRWVEASLIEPAAAERIRQFESSHTGINRLQWPVWTALGLGSVALSAGLLLFASAHWNDLSPLQRMLLVLAILLAFHLGGAYTANRFRALSLTLHVAGTACLGATLALTGQIFNLNDHWPRIVLLWSAGALCGWLCLRHWTQAALAAFLAPLWLASEWWFHVAEDPGVSSLPAPAFLFLISVTYLSGIRAPSESSFRRALAWVGGTALLPLAAGLSFGLWNGKSSLLPWHFVVLIPLAIAFRLRGRAALWNLGLVAWTVGIAAVSGAHDHTVATYFWDALGAIALVWWGMHEKRAERVNLGVAGFAITVVVFYFSNVMDKLDRAASLLLLGALFLGGGWLLERVRRRLIRQTLTI